MMLGGLMSSLLRILILFLIISAPVCAQGVKGRVIHSDTGEPLKDVHVLIKGSASGTVTDLEGRFSFNDIQVGTIIRFSSIGFATVEEVVNPGAGIEVKLSPEVLLLNRQVDVTAQRTENIQFNVTGSVSSVNSDQLKYESPRTVPEALSSVTGVWVQKTNHGGGSPIMRGLVGNQVLILVDGIRLNNTTYRYGPNQYLSTVDPGIVNRIEVNRGSGSVLYGSDALGGTIQVLSKNPLFNSKGTTVHGTATGRWMGRGMEKSTRGEVEVRAQKMAFLGGFSYRDFGDLVAGRKYGTLSPSGYHESAFDAKLKIVSGSKGLFTAALQSLVQRDVDRYDQVVQGGYKLFRFSPQQRQLAYLGYEYFPGKKFIGYVKSTLALHRTVEGIESQKNNSEEMKRQHDQVSSFSYSGEIHSRWNESWSSISGVEMYYDRVNSKAINIHLVTGESNSVRGSFANGATSSNLAIFTNHEYQDRRWILNGGMRYNLVSIAVDDVLFGSQTFNPSAWVGNVGVSFLLNEEYRIYTSYNTAFRAPNIDDLSRFGPVESTVFEIPGFNLEPEKSSAVEAGIKVNTPSLTAAMAVFHNRLDDLIDRVPAMWEGNDSVENRRVYQKQNVGSARVYGAEAEVEWKLFSSLVAFSGITYTHGTNFTKNEPLRRIPPLFGKAGVRYRKSNLFLQGEWVVAGEQSRLAAGDLSDARISVRLVDNRMPGWNIVNLYTGYEWKNVHLQISLQNIFDKSYRVYASGIDANGRNITASAQIKF